MILSRLNGDNGSSFHSIEEMTILSTCNRVEIYATAEKKPFQSLESFLVKIKNLSPEEFSSHIYKLSGEEAIDHLLHVASGIDSMVLGEPQILGQVNQALAIARSQNTTGKILSQVFRSAIRAGKRARHETKICRNPTSIASVSVKLISNAVPDLEKAQIIVLGAGEMAELAIKALRARDASKIWVVNRTLEQAQKLATCWDGSAFAFDRFSELLPHADILIASTGAPHTIVSHQAVKDAMIHRPDRPLIIMDIAVPRDVEDQVAAIPGVFLHDIDALSERLDDALAEREYQIPYVAKIIDQEKEYLLDYLQTLDVVPVIKSMHQKANKIRASELEKTLRQMPDLSSQQQHQIEILSKSLVKKILHDPTMSLRDVAGSTQASVHTTITRNLFNL